MLIVDIKDKSFGRKQVFKDFHLEFEDKKLYILKGVSGIGKTTLFRIISGLDTDFKGSILNGGFSNVSYHFQEYRLFGQLTALQNISMVSFENSDDKNLDRSRQILSRLGFAPEEMNLYPDELSGGMKQRVAFARAVLKDSPILLLDEPTKELDPSVVDEMCRIIDEESQKRTVILITHNDHSAKFSSYIPIEL